MLATALIAVATLALVGVQLQGMRLTRQSRQHWAASQLAREMLARLQDVTPDDYPKSDVTYENDPADASGFPPAPYPTARRDGIDFHLRVRHELSGTQGHLFVVKVSWGGGSSTMSTLVGP